MRYHWHSRDTCATKYITDWLTHSLSDNLKSRDPSASKNFNPTCFLNRLLVSITLLRTRFALKVIKEKAICIFLGISSPGVWYLDNCQMFETTIQKNRRLLGKVKHPPSQKTNKKTLKMEVSPSCSDWPTKSSVSWVAHVSEMVRPWRYFWSWLFQPLCFSCDYRHWVNRLTGRNNVLILKPLFPLLFILPQVLPAFFNKIGFFVG